MVRAIPLLLSGASVATAQKVEVNAGPTACNNNHAYYLDIDPDLSANEASNLISAIVGDSGGSGRRLQEVSGNNVRIEVAAPALSMSMRMSAAGKEDAENEAVVDHLMSEFQAKGLRAAGPDCEYVAFQSIPSEVYQCGDNRAWNMEATCCEDVCSGGNSGTCAYDPEGQIFDPDDIDTVVFVVDTGANPNHDIFQTNGSSRLLKQFDCYSSLSCPEVDKTTNADGNGHGTHCAGSAIGNIYGVNQKAGFVSIQVLGANGSGSSMGVRAGVQKVADMCGPGGEYEAQNCVLSLSLGGYGCPSLDSQAAYKNAAANGVIVVAAAGNSGQDASGFNPACYGGYGVPGHGSDGLEHPGGIVSVGATTSAEQLAYFSNYGDMVQINAPGFGILSASNRDNSSIVSKSGTSMAAPHVAGVFSQCLMEESKFDSSLSIKQRNEKCFEAILDCESEKIISTPAPGPLGENQPLIRRYQAPFRHSADSECKTCGRDAAPAPSPGPEPTSPPDTTTPRPGPPTNTTTPRPGPPTNTTTPAPGPPTSPPPSDTTTPAPAPTNPPIITTTRLPTRPPSTSTTTPAPRPPTPSTTTRPPQTPAPTTTPSPRPPSPTTTVPPAEPDMDMNSCRHFRLRKNFNRLKNMCRNLLAEYDLQSPKCQPDAKGFTFDIPFDECCKFRCGILNRKWKCKLHADKCAWEGTNREGSCEPL